MSKLDNSQPRPGAEAAKSSWPPAIREELQRILSSPRFLDSPRLSAFLRFVVEAKLSGREDQIKEYTIGVEVFDRGESFDPRIDSIVRVEARRLRDRLSEYYAANGKGNLLEIELPQRGYAPRFTHNGGRRSAPLKSNHYVQKARRLLTSPFLPWAIALAAIGGIALLLLQKYSSPGENVVALSVAPPAGGVLLTPARGGGPAVSPDGTRFVFSAQDETGETSLYLRFLDQVQPFPLAGTEDAAWPFWSPDGSKIGFGASGKLSILDVEREEIRTIADVPGYRGGTWSQIDGGVIVVSTARGPLLRIPSAGGTLRPALPLQPGERGHGQPVFLPDGKRLLYAPSRLGGSGQVIRVADLASGESRLLPGANSIAKYAQSADGRHFLLSSEAGELSARRIDAETLEPLSPAVSLAGGLPLYGAGTFSVAGSTLAYFHGPFPISRSRLVWRSRTGQRLGVLGNPDNYISVSLSPDEQTVAAGISSDHADVWTIDVSTGVATRQTTHPKLDRTPVWSPDGRQILISTDRDDDGGRIYILAADGAARAEPWLDYPPNSQFSDWPTQWHEKTSGVLFHRRGADDYDVWEKLPGRPPRSLIGGIGSQINARLSPDQRHVAYASNELGDWQIFLWSYSSTGSRIRVSPAGGNYPLWNRDGSELYYAAPDGSVMAVEVSAEQPLKASLPRPLFRVRFPVPPSSSTVYQYAAAKDGDRFLVVEEIEGPSATAILHWERLLDR